MPALDYMSNTYGLPMNPLTGSEMDWGSSPFLKYFRRQVAIPPESYRMPRMENPGITGTAGMGTRTTDAKDTAIPQEINTPDPVSAQDPSYSMHPMLRLASMLGGVNLPKGYGSPFMQLGQDFYKKNLTKTQLLTALGMPGLEWGDQMLQAQGMSDIGK